MRRRPTLKTLQKIVDRFNADYRVGSPVRLRTDSQGWIETTVIHQARVLEGHSAVAWFAGVSGAYSIDHGRVARSAVTTEA